MLPLYKRTVSKGDRNDVVDTAALLFAELFSRQVMEELQTKCKQNENKKTKIDSEPRKGLQ